MQTKEYDSIAPIYDEVMGTSHTKHFLELYVGCLESVDKLVGKRILDLGCGTGTLLSVLSAHNETVGVDTSAEMIARAREKDPASEYYVANITNFSFEQPFDYVFCTFDTINHLQTLEEWEQVFKLAASHLTDEGAFLFDFNTQEKFKNLDGKSLVRETENGIFILRTILVDAQKMHWKVDMFEQAQSNLFRHSASEIMQSTFDLNTVIAILNKYFSIVEEVAREENDGRVYLFAKR